jgi:hypothetical protein
MSYLDLLASCPGACGDLARAFNAAHEYDQPGMALATAIATFAAIRSGKVEYKEVQPNLYFCILGDSGIGKTRMLGNGKKALAAVNASKLDMHPPASGVALFDRVALGERLLRWDEFGEVLKQIVGSKNGYAVDILRRVKILFNEYQNVLGNAYANNSEATITDIKEGYLSLLTCSTVEHLQDVLHSDLVRDGLIPRFLFIESEATSGNARENDLVLPKSFLQQAGKELKLRTGNLVETLPTSQAFEPQAKVTLRWANDALAHARAYREYTRKERMLEANKSKLVIYNRKFEMFTKLVLAISDNAFAEMPHVLFAEDFVETVIGRQVEICLTMLGRTAFTKMDEEVLAAVPSDKWASLSEIHGLTRGLSPTQRRDVLADLVARGEIYCMQDKEAVARRKPMKYTRSVKLVEQVENASNPAHKLKVEREAHERYLKTGLVPADEFPEWE